MATAWNTYRKSHLYLLDIMIQINQRLQVHDNTITITINNKVAQILPAFVASIPYLLSHNINEYLDAVQSGGSSQLFPTPNHPVGGLLLLHPLYCVAINPAVPLPDRRYCARSLDCIGREMGIGQASFLARATAVDFGSGSQGDSIIPKKPDPDPRLPRQALSESHNLIWAGMLLQSG
jgi:hypothetical protein